MSLILGLIVASPITTILPVIYISYLIKKKRVKVVNNYWNLGILFLFIWAFIVGLLNNDYLSSLGAFLLLGYYIISIGSERVIQSKYKFYMVLRKLTLFSTIAAIIGILEKIYFLYIGYGRHRVYSLFGNPNMAGAWFACSIFIISYIATNKDIKCNTVKYYIALFIITIALLLTGSRGAAVATIGTSVIITLVFYMRKYKKFAVGMIALSAIIVVVSFSNIGFISNYITAHPIEDSVSPRLKVWDGGIDMIKEKPLQGWGLLATYTKGEELLPKYNMNTVHVHNLWLSLLSSLGIIGFSCYMLMKIFLYRDLFKLYKVDKNITLLFIAINLITIIQGTIDVTLYAPQLGILFVSMGGITQKLLRDYNLTTELNISKKLISISTN